MKKAIQIQNLKMLEVTKSYNGAGRHVSDWKPAVHHIRERLDRVIVVWSDEEGSQVPIVGCANNKTVQNPCSQAPSENGFFSGAGFFVLDRENVG